MATNIDKRFLSGLSRIEKLEVWLNRAEANVNFMGESAVNGAIGSRLHQLAALFVGEWTCQFDRNLDPIDHSIFGEAFFTIVRVDARVR